jgi:hypothetical protein
MLAEIRTDSKTDREELKGMMTATQERTEAFTKSMREDIKSGQEEIRSIVDAWMTDMNNDRKETMYCQETTACHNEMEVNIKKMEPNLREKGAVVERRKIPNEEIAVHSLRACRSETTAAQEASEANTEKTEPDRGMMLSVAEHRVALMEDAVVKPVNGRKKRHRGRKPQGDAESQRN